MDNNFRLRVFKFMSERMALLSAKQLGYACSELAHLGFEKGSMYYEDIVRELKAKYSEV